MIARLDVDEIVARQRGVWRWSLDPRADMAAEIASLRSSSPRQHGAPAAASPLRCGRGHRRPDWGVAIGAAVLLLLAIAADCVQRGGDAATAHPRVEARP